MSRGITKTELICPICNENLSKTISGELKLADHDYGFYTECIADGYECENDHIIFIKIDELD